MVNGWRTPGNSSRQKTTPHRPDRGIYKASPEFAYRWRSEWAWAGPSAVHGFSRVGLSSDATARTKTPSHHLLFDDPRLTATICSRFDTVAGVRNGSDKCLPIPGSVVESPEKPTRVIGDELYREYRLNAGPCCSKRLQYICALCADRIKTTGRVVSFCRAILTLSSPKAQCRAI